MKHSIITFIKFSILWLVFIAFPFIHAGVLESKKPIIHDIQPAESSLYTQATKKVAQQVNKLGYEVLQKLPAQQIMDVLNECIFTTALITWSFKDKEKLVVHVSKFESMEEYRNKLQGLIWTLKECQKLEQVDPSIMQELKDTNTYVVSLDIPPIALPFYPEGLWKAVITVSLEKTAEPSIEDADNYNFQIKVQVIDDLGDEYSCKTFPPYGMEKPITSFNKTKYLVGGLYQQVVGMPEYSFLYNKNCLQTIITAVERLALAEMLKDCSLYSLTDLAREIVKRFSNVYVKDKSYDLEEAYKLLGHIWSDSKLTTLQKRYLRFMFSEFFSLYKPHIEKNEIKQKITYAIGQLKGIRKKYEVIDQQEYTVSAIDKEDDASRFQVLLALMPEGLFFNFDIDINHPRVNHPRINKLLFALGRNVNRKPKKGEQENPRAFGHTSPLFKAVIAGDFALVDDLLAHGADPNNVMYFDESSVRGECKQNAITANILILAVVGNHPEIIHLLIKAGADVNALCPITGKTVIEHAYENGNQHIVDLLKHQGVDDKLYQQRKLKQNMHAQLPTLEKLQKDAVKEHNEPILDFVQQISEWDLPLLRRSAILQRYFETAKLHFARKTKLIISILELEQFLKQEAYKDQLREEFLAYSEKRPTGVNFPL